MLAITHLHSLNFVHRDLKPVRTLQHPLLAVSKGQHTQIARSRTKSHSEPVLFPCCVYYSVLRILPWLVTMSVPAVLVRGLHGRHTQAGPSTDACARRRMSSWTRTATSR